MRMSPSARDRGAGMSQLEESFLYLPSRLRRQRWAAWRRWAASLGLAHGRAEPAARALPTALECFYREIGFHALAYDVLLQFPAVPGLRFLAIARTFSNN